MQHETSFIEQLIGSRLLERLTCLKINPERILVLGWDAAFLAAKIAALYPNAKVLIDPQQQSFDLIFVNCNFSPAEKLGNTFSQLQSILNVNGTLLFTSFGAKTLADLAFESTWPDMHRIGDTLLELQFANPVIDTEVIKIEYESLQDLLADLRDSGRYEISDLAFPELYLAYTAQIEIIYGHAVCKAREPRQFTDSQGRTYIATDTIKCL